MKYQLDPLSPTGVSPVALASQMSVSSGINLGAHTTDELPEGSTNLYSQWEVAIYGTADYLQPKDDTQGMVIGQPLHSSVTTSFAAASAVFNDSAFAPSTGVNYFIEFSYGTSGLPLGSLFVGGRALGTAAAPTALNTADLYIGGYGFVGYGSSGWLTNGSNSHIVPGMWASTATALTTLLDANVWIGGALTKMIGFETDTNAIKFNEAALDSDMTFYSDTGTPFYIDGAGTGKAVFGSTTTTSGLVSINGDLYFHKETARTIQVDDTTTAATAGAALSIAAGAGSATTSGTGGALTLTAGAGRAGISAGGAVNIKGGAGFIGGSILVDVGGGFAGATMKIGSVTATPTAFGNLTPTATVHIKAGATAASSAPLKFTTGTNMTTAEVGAMEFTTGRLYFTPVLTRNIITSTTTTNTTAVGNITTGEDDLMTYSVPANTMGTNGDYMSFRASGTIANNANAKRIRIKYGATTILDTGAAGLPASVAASWKCEAEVIRTGAATQKCSGKLEVGNGTTYPFVAYVTAAETLSGAVTLKLTGEATSTNDIVQETLTVRLN